MLTNPSLDLAVAWGAAYFAWLRHTGGKRIGGGIARSYYIAVEGGASADGEAKPLTVVCVVPQHLEEGQDIELDKPELELAIGQPVTFPLYTSTVRADDKAGDVAVFAGEQLCFSSCDGDLEHDIITSPLLAIERPSKELARRYDEMRT